MSFRIPDETRVGAVHLQVADLARSLDYYRGVLGLRVLDQGAHAAILGADSPLVHLRERPGARPVPRRGAYGLFHFAVLLPDRASLGRFVRHLAQVGLRAGMADHRVSEALYLSDPDGLGIEVYADRPKDTWLRQGDELVMTTDPLDVADLAAAGGGQAWEGAPSGTTMGHVHLHVGDLEQAAAFYHRALGMNVTVWSYPGALFLAAGGYHHHLGTNTWSPGPAAAEDQAHLLHWELIVPGAEDATAAAASLRSSGFRVVPGAEGFATEDPWGTKLHVRPRA